MLQMPHGDLEWLENQLKLSENNWYTAKGKTEEELVKRNKPIECSMATIPGEKISAEVCA